MNGVTATLQLRGLDGEALDAAMIAYLHKQGYVVTRKAGGTMWETPGEFCARVGLHTSSFHRSLLQTLKLPHCPAVHIEWGPSRRRVSRLASNGEFESLMLRNKKGGDGQ